MLRAQRSGHAYAGAGAILALALLLAAGMALHRRANGRPALRDFFVFYSAAELQRSGGPLYDMAAQQRAQAPYLDRGTPYMPFLRPPVMAWLMRPLLRLPPLPAAAVWLLLQVAAAAAAAIWLTRRTNMPEVLLLVAIFPPLIVAIVTGQDTPLLLLDAVLLLALLERQRDAAAALPLAALWMKPTLLPAFVVLVAAQRRWRTLAGFAVLAAIMGIVAPAGYFEFLRGISATPGVPPCVECMPNVRALMPASAAWAAAAVALIVLLAFATRLPLEAGFALACTVAVAAGLYSHLYDCLFLLPGIVLLGRPRGAAPAPAAVLITAIFALALSPLPWLLPYWSASLRRAPALMSLAMLAAAIYATRVAISSPRSTAYREALPSDQR